MQSSWRYPIRIGMDQLPGSKLNLARLSDHLVIFSPEALDEKEYVVQPIAENLYRITVFDFFSPRWLNQNRVICEDGAFTALDLSHQLRYPIEIENLIANEVEILYTAKQVCLPLLIHETARIPLKKEDMQLRKSRVDLLLQLSDRSVTFLNYYPDESSKNQNSNALSNQLFTTDGCLHVIPFGQTDFVDHLSEIITFSRKKHTHAGTMLPRSD